MVGYLAGVHKDVVRGVRWLGPSSLLASFSSEKAAGGYCNRLLLTDVRTRISLPFRDIPSEPSAMLGIRASNSGRYLLILLRAAPSEIWMVCYFHQPSTFITVHHSLAGTGSAACLPYNIARPSV